VLNSEWTSGVVRKHYKDTAFRLLIGRGYHGIRSRKNIRRPEREILTLVGTNLLLV
jgi:hypothetical protein